ncbi:MAG: hypothetical protein ACOX68_06775 [Candidatus Limivicinus sp.]|jgi:hypothetical protein
MNKKACTYEGYEELCIIEDTLQAFAAGLPSFFEGKIQEIKDELDSLGSSEDVAAADFLTILSEIEDAAKYILISSLGSGIGNPEFKKPSRGMKNAVKTDSLMSAIHYAEEAICDFCSYVEEEYDREFLDSADSTAYYNQPFDMNSDYDYANGLVQRLLKLIANLDEISKSAPDSVVCAFLKNTNTSDEGPDIQISAHEIKIRVQSIIWVFATAAKLYNKLRACSEQKFNSLSVEFKYMKGTDRRLILLGEDAMQEEALLLASILHAFGVAGDDTNVSFTRSTVFSSEMKPGGVCIYIRME